MRLFFDTSALVKRYVEEPGSDTVQMLCEEADELMVSIICLPEMLSTLNSLRRERKLSDERYAELKSEMQMDINDAMVCSISQAVLSCAVTCLEKYPLRAMDALHLGCALSNVTDKFISADIRQLDAAIACGLKVVNPEGLS
jgi:uncharacterized protein